MDGVKTRSSLSDEEMGSKVQGRDVVSSSRFERNRRRLLFSYFLCTLIDVSSFQSMLVIAVLFHKPNNLLRLS